MNRHKEKAERGAAKSAVEKWQALIEEIPPLPEENGEEVLVEECLRSFRLALRDPVHALCGRRAVEGLIGLGRWAGKGDRTIEDNRHFTFILQIARDPAKLQAFIEKGEKLLGPVVDVKAEEEK